MSNYRLQIFEIVEASNYEEIKSKIAKEQCLLKYQTILSIGLHIINALSIILSVISETIQVKITNAVFFCNISNVIIIYFKL